MTLKNIDLSKDIYYSSAYSDLYGSDISEIHRYSLNDYDGSVLNVGVKKPIEKIGKMDLKEIYYDVETIYGYGGFFTDIEDETTRVKLFSQYEKYCKDHKIIAEFFRFHPFNDFPRTNSSSFDFVSLDREVVYIDLEKSQQDRWADYSTNTRNILRRCQKELKIELSDDIAQFIKMYYETMQRNQAGDFYYFSENYFRKLLAIDDVYLFSVTSGTEIIAMAFIMLGKDIAHYHLSANKTEYMKLNANYLVLDESFEFARGKGKKFFMLGGGRTNHPDDSLFAFKKKFSKLTLPYYIAGKVYLPEIYSDYNRKWKDQTADDAKYFLKYRLPINNEK